MSIKIKPLYIIGILILLVAIPLTIILVRQQQIFRSKATGSVSYSFSPASASHQVNEGFDVQITLDTSGSNVSFVDFNMTFNKDVLQLGSFTPSSTFNTIVTNAPPDNSTGTFHFVAGNNSTTQVVGSSVVIGTIHLVGKANGVGQVTLSSKETTLRTDPPSDVTANGATGTYTITSTAITGTVSPSPTTTANKVSFQFNPPADSKQVGNSFDVGVGLNTGSNNVSFVDFTISYDKNLLNMDSFSPTTTLNTVVTNGPPNNDTGTFHFVAGNNSNNPVTGSNINLGIIHFKAKANGTAQVKLDSKELTVRNNGSPTDIAADGASGVYTIQAGPTPPPPSSPPVQVFTVSYKLAETIGGLADSANQWLPYNSDPTETTFKFADSSPGAKQVCVQFKGSDGTTSTPQCVQIELVNQPTITGCNLDFDSAGSVSFTIFGQGFGTKKGTVTVSDRGAGNLLSWTDTQVKTQSFSGAPTGQNFPITLTTSQGTSADGICSAISQLALGAKLFCPQVTPRDITGVQITLAEGIAGGKVYKQTVTLTKDGVITGLTTKLVEGRDYSLGIKVAKSVRRVVQFTAVRDTTNVNITPTGTNKLPLGDIFPLDGGDGVINSADKAEMNREWVIDSQANVSLARPGDLNNDSLVNSFDWSCMRQDFNSADAPEPQGGPISGLSSSPVPSSGSTNNVTVVNTVLSPVPTVGSSGTKRVFVTSQTYDGNLGGITGGDQKCQTSANSANLGGSWKAWLSDSNTDAKNRIPDAKYVRIDGQTIANSKAILTSNIGNNFLQNPIDIDERGNIYSSSHNGVGQNPEVWTGTEYNGTKIFGTASNGTQAVVDCSDWTTNASNLSTGVTGLSNITFGVGWTRNAFGGVGTLCYRQASLYCFEQ